MTGAIETAVLTMLGFVLASAGVTKLRRQPPIAVAELIVSASAIVAPARLSGPVLAAVFATFATTHLRRWRSGREECGCFGEDADAASAPRAAVLTVTSAALAAAAAVAGPSSLADFTSRHPATAPVVGLAALLGAVGWRLAFSARLDGPAAGNRLVNSSALFLERRFSRRSLLLRIAVAGSALAVAPLRYLLYPGSALAAITPGECSGGECTDGFTGFCCQINDGLNTCPRGTFPGGWWMCTDYRGRQLCSEAGVRYYVDCNALPDLAEVHGGCHCGGGSCGNRRIGCNIFRYGQCNTHIAGVTAVVCRMVVCENPSSIPALNCSSSLAVDNAVCDHEAPCLERPALELAGAGGV